MLWHNTLQAPGLERHSYCFFLWESIGCVVLGVLGFGFFYLRTELMQEAAAEVSSFWQGSSEHPAYQGGASASASQPQLRHSHWASALSQEEGILHQGKPMFLQE